MLFTTSLAYLEDIIIFGRNYIEMLHRLDTALERLGQANLKLKPSKCSFGKTLLNFKGISIDPEKLCRIKEWPRPHNPDEARNFLGSATYYRKFIKNFAHIMEPLNKLLIKNSQFQLTKNAKFASPQ